MNINDELLQQQQQIKDLKVENLEVWNLLYKAIDLGERAIKATLQGRDSDVINKWKDFVDDIL